MCLEVSTQVTQATMLTTQVHLLESELSIKTDRRIPLPRINSIITTTRAISQATETVRTLPTLHTSLRSLRDLEVESLQVSMEERCKDHSLGITIWVRKREEERKIFMNLLNLIHTPTRYSSRSLIIPLKVLEENNRLCKNMCQVQLNNSSKARVHLNHHQVEKTTRMMMSQNCQTILQMKTSEDSFRTNSTTEMVDRLWLHITSLCPINILRPYTRAPPVLNIFRTSLRQPLEGILLPCLQQIILSK